MSHSAASPSSAAPSSTTRPESTARFPRVILPSFPRRRHVTPERIVGALLEGALGGRRKRSRGALGYLTGGRGGSLVNAKTLLAAAGLAWGAYEAATRNKGQASASPGGGFPQLPPPGPLSTSGGPLPPLPGVGGAPLSGSYGVPPLPGAPVAAGPPADLLRLVRLTISAARVDGTLSEEERAQILEQARAVGAEAMVEEEMRNPKALGEIVKGPISP